MYGINPTPQSNIFPFFISSMKRFIMLMFSKSTTSLPLMKAIPVLGLFRVRKSLCFVPPLTLAA